MAWSKYQIYLTFMMLITGSINTLSTKWADDLSSKGRDGVIKKFDHPFFQASCMFFGEFLCLVIFHILYKVYSRRGDGYEHVSELTKGNTQVNKLLLFIPAMCDMCATSIMYIGLNLTFASSFQMLRGSVNFFVGILSVSFLDRVLKRQEWFGIFSIIFGLVIVGVADMLSNSTGDHGINGIITGDLLIILAQIITACQMVIEEKYISGLNIPPLQCVGWEGLFGLVTLSFLQILFFFIPAGSPFSADPKHLEDALDAFVQIFNNWQLLMAICGTIISIAFFNFAGISVTKEFSATTRMVIDSVRTIVIWAFSLAFLGQSFHWLQLLGFTFLMTGMCLYNKISFWSIFIKIKNSATSLRYGKVDDEQIENHPADTP